MRIRPLRALRGLATVILDPEQTEAGATMVGALTGRSWERLFERFAASPVGTRVLDEDRRLDETLCDRPALAELPNGSLGREYFEWTEREGIGAAGLLEVPLTTTPGCDRSAAHRLFALRERVAHDLWHVLTGYGRDLLGEAALLQMMWIHTRNTGLLLPVTLSRLSHCVHPEGRFVLADARRRARACAWLPGLDWEHWLERPLGEAREATRLGDPPRYEPIWQRPHLSTARNQRCGRS